MWGRRRRHAGGRCALQRRAADFMSLRRSGKNIVSFF